MTTRDEALTRIASLAREHDVSLAEIEALLAAPAPEDAPRRAGVVGNILAYLGGIFVFAGIGVFVGLHWDTMNTAARIIASLGSGLAAFVMGVVSLSDARFERVSTPLFLVAALLQPMGILIAIDELSAGGEWRHAVLLTCGVMVAQQGATFGHFRRTTLLFTTLAFSLWLIGTALDLVGIDWAPIVLLLGAGTVSTCMGLERTAHREITPFWYLMGAAGVYAGLFDLVEQTPLELGFLLVACGGLVLSAWLRRRTLLFASTVAILGFVAWFTAEHFVGSIGWPLALVALGIFLLLLSALALRINRRYIARSDA
ncbi:MAG: DUF2157 domain-containing protein [Myxococcota bacterium]